MSKNEKPRPPLKVATAFSGGLAAVEFALKYENFKHEIIFACEWDKYARKQYLEFHNEPKTFYKDIKELCAKKYFSLIDLFVWGSPCQDISLSGKRKGLAGQKSSHFFHGARVQDEIKPKIFIFENVAGLLSSTGHETAKDYDCLNLSRPSSKTRRGRVGKGYAQTLECGGNIGVIYNSMIRRLTPFETFRLQGVKEEDIKLIVSDTQSYKISGNAINVTVMRHILKSLYQRQKVTSQTSLFDFI